MSDNQCLVDLTKRRRENVHDNEVTEQGQKSIIYKNIYNLNIY